MGGFWGLVSTFWRRTSSPWKAAGLGGAQREEESGVAETQASRRPRHPGPVTSHSPGQQAREGRVSGHSVQEPRQRLHQVPSRKLSSRCGAAKPKPAARIWAEPPNIKGIPDEMSEGYPEKGQGEECPCPGPRSSIAPVLLHPWGSPSQGLPFACCLPTSQQHTVHTQRGLAGEPTLTENLGIKPGSPALQADSLPAELPRKPDTFLARINKQSLYNLLSWTTLLPGGHLATI